MKGIEGTKKKQSIDRGISPGLQDYDLDASCRLCTTSERSDQWSVASAIRADPHAAPSCLSCWFETYSWCIFNRAYVPTPLPVIEVPFQK